MTVVLECWGKRMFFPHWLHMFNCLQGVQRLKISSGLFVPLVYLKTPQHKGE